MEKFTKELLTKLVDKYQRSVLSKDGSKRKLAIKININDNLFNDYKDYRNVESIEHQLKDLEKFEFILIHTDRKENICFISLNINKINDIYEFLKIKNPTYELNNIIKILQSYKCVGITKNFIDDEISYIRRNYKYHKCYYEDINDLENLLRCLNEIQGLSNETMERDFSVKVLNDSKKFSVKYKNRIVSIIKMYICELKDLNDDEILKEFNLINNTSYVFIKNNLVFNINKQTIDLSKLGFEFSLNDQMIDIMEIQDSQFKNVITVENLTSFKMLKDTNSVIIFLSGFNSHTKQMLLRKIYNKYPNKNYYHFGDIDVGGIRIFTHLRKSTNIPFMPYRMSIKELEENFSNLKQLTKNDIDSLGRMKKDENYKLFEKEINYMLANNVKLEQELLD